MKTKRILAVLAAAALLTGFYHADPEDVGWMKKEAMSAR